MVIIFIRVRVFIILSFDFLTVVYVLASPVDPVIKYLLYTYSVGK